MTATSTLAPAAVNVRIKNSAGWTSMLLAFAFAFVDIFSLYRPDVGSGSGLATRSSLPWDP